MSLPTDPKARKHIPIYRGFFCYFPDAIAAVAELSMIGNEQHNPGEPLHWAKEKSTDEEDSLLRHMLDKASGRPVDTDRVRHATKVAWRAFAALQREIEAEQAAHLMQIVERGELPTNIYPGAIIEGTRPQRTETFIPAREDRVCPVCGDPEHAPSSCSAAWEQRDKRASER